ncbi:hypothetical protein SKAU_G00186480 [Synaphobranchus kaupii]|uniref:Uncharacterized protein n=1 Tax=Synaphobranchus kaupii TaxID=118154 RepID=A0A9Q1IVY1_SYNKA|nr:hypothetical protein SKAU_G00186480 [Synaphobranchus kaupii]
MANESQWICKEDGDPQLEQVSGTMVVWELATQSRPVMARVLVGVWDGSRRIAGPGSGPLLGSALGLPLLSEPLRDPLRPYLERPGGKTLAMAPYP